MKIVRIIGGLGNQMFQYAFYKSLKFNYPNEKILLDCSLFNTYNLHYGFELDKVFELDDLFFATDYEIKRLSWHIPNYFIQRLRRRILPKLKTEYIEKSEFGYDDRVFNSDSYYYEGYWQNPNYFLCCNELIKSSFKFKNILCAKNTDLMTLIKTKQSVSIHVRRGDYINHKSFGGICEIDYYKKAISITKQRFNNPTFFIFSNDYDWCKELIVPLISDSDFHFVDWNVSKDSFFDLHLMSNCKVNIIANSSFSWWAGWLNPENDKFVIAPSKWTKVIPSNNLLPNEWVKI